MTNYIKILPERIVNKIAAGEVISRPESAIKELIENSIDAGAKNITLVVKDSGKTLMQIIDNGTGMNSDDAKLCFVRHSTSKISTDDDLDCINTLGFRGEALASIAAVSQVELKTKTSGEELGTQVLIDDSKVINISRISYDIGTSISVKNLYYNVPARRSFLKSDSTELKHIIDTFQRFAICYPEIKFKMLNDEHLVYEYNSSNYLNRIKSVFKNLNENDLIEFQEDIDFIKVKGYIAKPVFLKKNRGNQFLFLNRRYIQNKAINHAIKSAYESFTKIEGFPFYLVFITIDPSIVDVNVHPSKLEVKFSDERSIYNVINSIIKKALGSQSLAPDFNFDSKKEILEENFKNNDIGSVETPKSISSFSRNTFTPTFKQERFNQEEYSNLFKLPEEDSVFLNKIKHTHEYIEIQHDEKDEVNDSKGIWQIHFKYIIAQIKSGIVIIDQHVAHERILYEKAIASFDTNLPFSQQLLFPKTLILTPDDYILVKEILDDLTNLGFIIKIGSDNSIVMDGIPSDVKFGNEESIFLEILNDFKNNREPNSDKKDLLLRTFACKAAIKSGDRLSETEIISLVDQLFATKMPYVCPHGRPIMIKITINELDKRFGRN